MPGTEQGPGQGCRPAVEPIYCSLDQCGCFSSPEGSEDSRVLPKINSHRVTQANISSEKRWTVAHVSFFFPKVGPISEQPARRAGAPWRVKCTALRMVLSVF